jgi:hypothetical protein
MFEYPINSHGVDSEQATAVLKKHLPVEYIFHCYVSNDVVIEVQDDWLQGRKPTLELVKQRKVFVLRQTEILRLAIIATEEELGHVV